jgi:hypothetical protein
VARHSRCIPMYNTPSAIPSTRSFTDRGGSFVLSMRFRPVVP